MRIDTMAVIAWIVAGYFILQAIFVVLCLVVAFLEPELFSKDKNRLKSVKNRLLGKCHKCKHLCEANGCYVCTSKKGCIYIKKSEGVNL